MNTSDTDLGNLTLLTPGPHTLLQDLGRKNTQHLGFCQSGALDEHSFLWANKLLDNNKNAASLEITLGPFEAQFSQASRIAITGAAPSFYLNNIEHQSWQSVRVRTGDKIRIKPPQKGTRTYLSIQNGFQYASNFDSASMVIKEKSGPYQGKTFEKNSTLNFFPYEKFQLPNRSTPNHFIPNYDAPLELKIILDGASNIFEDRAIADFLKKTYRVGSNSNRMAYCLEGNPIKYTQETSIYSSGVPFGSVQVPPNGQPIVLLKDRQTIGGYPIIGYVSHLSCFKLAQLHIGQEVSFTPASIENCQKELLSFRRFF